MVVSIQSIDKSQQNRRNSAQLNSQTCLSSIEEDKLQLITCLQSTLDLELMLNKFLESLNDFVKVDGIYYQEDERDLKLKLGRQSGHSCGYRLINNETSFGELVFKRSKRFSEEELQQIESFVILLLIPIGNALKYLDAVEQAIAEPVANIGDKVLLEHTLVREIELAKRHNHSLSLLTLHFECSAQKKTTKLPLNIVNTIKDVVYDVCRNTDRLFRSGGKEFRLIMHNDASGARPIAKRIERSLRKAFNEDDGYGLEVSSGFSTLTGTDSVKSLVERAKNQMLKSAR
ncbi:MAG: diguanylate cyclase [Pseudomonadales bacterium]|nr:diguanylate cyclase [Pseudomonadales bacterium]